MGPWRRRAARPGVASCTNPRAVNSSRRSVIGAYRTRWKHAPQPASLGAWPACNSASCSAFGTRRALAVSCSSRSSPWSPSDSPCSRRSGPAPAPGTVVPPSPSSAATIPTRHPRCTRPMAGSSPTGLERRTVVPLGEMSPYVKAAFITTEDKRFYEHHGIDWYRVFGAIKNNIFKFRVAEGFSTITMQLARNLWPEDISGRDKTLRRKLREAHVAQVIEAKYSKDKILELYLNQIDLGNRAFGVEAASQRYFGKSVRDVNVAEAATLAAIPKAQ